MLAIFVNNIFISDVVEISLVWTVIAIECRYNNVFICNILGFDPSLQPFASIRNITALSYDLIWKIFRMLD
ncbi:hypothetical protein D3C73_1162630 [compost metagenome]